MSDDDEAPRRIRFLRVLPSEDQARLLAASEVTTFKRGDPVFREGSASSSFDFVVRGRVKLAKAGEGGREVGVETVASRELICGSVPAVCGPYCCSSVAMEDDTQVLSIRRADVLELVERSPAVARALLHEMACRGADMCLRVDELSARRVEQRVAKLLLRLADRSGVVVPEKGTWVPIALTRQDIADLCGTTVETTIRVMSRFRRDGIVRAASRGFMVMDRGALEAIIAAT